jgi:hypothetical protein
MNMANATRLLVTAGSLAGLALVNEWLAESVPLLPFRMPLLLAVAFVAAIWLRPFPAPAPVRPVQADGGESLLAEVDHAIDHLRSAVVVLQVSQAYRQPLPPSMLLTLELVLKHLVRARPGAEDYQAPVMAEWRVQSQERELRSKVG